jgi:hypothetical protein
MKFFAPATLGGEIHMRSVLEMSDGGFKLPWFPDLMKELDLRPEHGFTYVNPPWRKDQPVRPPRNMQMCMERVDWGERCFVSYSDLDLRCFQNDAFRKTLEGQTWTCM